ncbi:hypothetical protein ACET3X_004621 [Alternaria dauci]|uniref:Uncharacterized protein n=1 Tax=Alternaria dauci TaxID=48095 RepID=A0ABR3UNF7_9PLEO
MKERNIEWYVTTGVLVEDCTGLRWNAGTYNYLLYWHVESMAVPGKQDTGQKWLKIEPDAVRDWQKDNWEADFGEAVMDVEDEPATPIVEDGNGVTPYIATTNIMVSFDQRIVLPAETQSLINTLAFVLLLLAIAFVFLSIMIYQLTMAIRAQNEMLAMRNCSQAKRE